MRSLSKPTNLLKHFNFDSKRLGKGAFGTVYLGTNKKDESIKFAVKEIKISKFTEQEIS